MIDGFYIVWCPTGSRATRVRHEQLKAAQAEAERLAATTPGAEFYVLRVVGVARKVVVTWTAADHRDPIPF